MHFMNEYEIEDAARRHQGHPVLGPATQTLTNLVNWTNRNSDGWPYWNKPAKAADRLMTLIEGDRRTSHRDYDREDATVEALNAALRPIKAFRTRQGADFTIITGKG